ncbi:MAG: hypothetical protein A2X12_09755 [Bacteroidetes bacterium GWE2_29_8]|nr:MAG: hypothetical protein A2X12_09755 [Bacteroidetes bacterium GWE2_29_8]OFY16615.1 MAG: hypothetical protein A2X02_05610 [Bacteroidetes bacterium GWF2_29_10]
MKRKNSLIVIFLITVSIFYTTLNGCTIEYDVDNNSNVVLTDTLKYDVSSFNKIYSLGFAKIFLTKGDEFSVHAISDKESLSKLDVSVSDNTLNIKNIDDDDAFLVKLFSSKKRNNQEVRIYVTLKNIESIVLKGSGDLYGTNAIKEDNLEIKVIGSGDVKINNLEVGNNLSIGVIGSGDVNVNNLEGNILSIDIVGSGDVFVAGKAKTNTSSIAGSGDIKAYNLIAENTLLSISGSGDAEIGTTQEIQGRISGSGDVKYNSSPKTINVSVSGSGRVYKR